MIARRLATGLAVAALAAGCGTAGPNASAPARPSGTVASMPPRSPSREAALAEPGRPFRASDVLAAMRTSRRPGGVPPELQSPEIATAVAEQIWTIDGAPWQAIAAGGSCGPDACTLELSGAAAGAAGEDVWVFEIPRDTGEPELVLADLHSVPGTLASELDGLARSLAPDATGGANSLTAVRWSPPPDENLFFLSYRSGDEEGSCAVEIELDAAVPEVREARSTDC